MPNVGDQTGGNDFKNTGAINPVVEGGNKLTQYRVDATPLDGLNIGADYSTEDGGDTGTAQQEESITLNMHLETSKLDTVNHFMRQQ